RYAYGAVAIPGPEFRVWSHHDAIGPRTIRGCGTATTWQGPSHASNTSHPKVILGVDNIDAEVGSISEIASLRSRVHRGNVSAGDRVAWDWDHADESNRRIHIVIMVITVLTVVLARTRTHTHTGSQYNAQT